MDFHHLTQFSVLIVCTYTCIHIIFTFAFHDPDTERERGRLLQEIITISQSNIFTCITFINFKIVWLIDKKKNK